VFQWAMAQCEDVSVVRGSPEFPERRANEIGGPEQSGLLRGGPSVTADVPALAAFQCAKAVQIRIIGVLWHITDRGLGVGD